MTRKRLTLVGLVAGVALCAALGRPHVARTTSGIKAAGIPSTMLANAAMSAAIATTVGGRGQLFQEVDLMGDWDGSEDNVADHSGKIDDLSATLTNPSQALTRIAMSEHTIANGFNEDIAYYGDSLGNVTVVSTTNLNDPSPTPTKFTINLPTVLNAFGNLNGNNVIVITGLAVEPAADLTSFANVNGNFASFAGKVGEVLYVSFTDNGGGFRLTNGQQLIRSGLLAFPVADITSGTTSPPGIISPTGFPVQVGGSFGVAFSVFQNPGGIAVDDDGAVYFHQADLIGLTGGNIVKIKPDGTDQTRSLATNGFIPNITTLHPPKGAYGSASGPAAQHSTATNYSGTSAFFGNIAAIATGPNNVLYAAVAASKGASAASGPFTNSPALGPTPSLIITFADNTGALDGCASAIPVADGFADAVVKGTVVPGVNNFRAFVLGMGPDRRDGGPVFGSTATTQKIPSFQVDYTTYAGITVDPEGKVYVISGGTPAGVGLNPSPSLGEILVFPDDRPYNLRADYMDLRGNIPPNSGASGGNQGNGVANRFDYIYWQAPLDPVTNTPTGIAGLSHGFLLYLNRTRTANNTPSLPNGSTQAANSSSSPEFWEHFDPSHQVAGGDDQQFPFKGDDSDGFSGPNDPSIAGTLNGGFEFVYGSVQAAVCTSPWNTFFLNSNGSVSFGGGNSSSSPATGSFLSGVPMIAPAWTALNTGSRASFSNTFPVQAMGFANINHFIYRWIDVPQAGKEACGSSNTFAVSLYDDGTGLDENATQTLNSGNPIGNNSTPFDLKEGPTDLRFKVLGGGIVGKVTRPDGSGYFTFRYGRMDLLGSAANPVLVGYSVGDQPSSPSGLCTTADIGNFPNGNLIGNNSQAAIFELFNTGTAATPAFDLRFEGTNRALSTPVGQHDLNRGLVRLWGVDCKSARTFSCPSSSAPW
jgi:hypothetical protein